MVKNSLPKRKVPFIGKLNITIGNFSASIKDFTDAVEEFEERFRGPLLSWSTRIQKSLDILIEKNFFYIFSAAYNAKTKTAFSELVINNKSASLNYKISFLLELLRHSEFEKKDSKKMMKGIELLDKKLDHFRRKRNLLAHCSVEPRSNSKKQVIDVILIHNDTEIKVTKNFIDEVVTIFREVDTVLNSYTENFKEEKI